MAETTKIEWTDHTFNPWSGCTKVAPGCKFCYAEVNYSVKMRGVKWGPNGNRVKASDSMWKQPLKWNREAANAQHNRFDHGPALPRPRVFCASLADVFEDWQGPVLHHDGTPLYYDGTCDGKPVYRKGTGMVPITLDDLRRDLFALIDATPNLDWLILTKRPENIGKMWPTEDDGAGGRLAEAIFGSKGKLIRRRDNVWLGCSVSDQTTADANLPDLLKCRDLAPVLFASYEPALARVDFRPFLHDSTCVAFQRETGLIAECICSEPREVHLDWAIIGGESGPHARQFDVAWARLAIEQCRDAGIACFVKQLGARPREWSASGPVDGGGEMLPLCLDDKKGGDPAEWPEGLAVREFPTANCASL